ncbi:hypothetical protein Tco_1515068 [Tanacetum coccineum]
MKCFRCEDLINLLENVQSHRETRTKEHLLEVLGTINGEEVMKDPRRDMSFDLEPDEWIKDSGCSKHMTGNRKLYSTYKAYNGGNVIFGSNLRGNIIGKGDDFLLDNLKFIPKGEKDEVFGKHIPQELITEAIQNLKYYEKYLEMADRKPAAKEGGKKKTTSKADKPTKPAPAKQHALAK